MKKLCIALLSTSYLLVLALPGRAAVVTALLGGSVIPMPVLNYSGAGPLLFGSGITWTSTNAAVFGYDSTYGYLDNGFWDGALGPMAGLNSGLDDIMTFSLPSPVAGIGGFLNYAAPGGDPTTIAVYDSAFTLIESFNLTFLTGSGTLNSGQFYGFLENTPIIKYFTLQDNFIGIVNLTVQDLPSSVPEPGSLLLLGGGLLGLIAAARHKR